MSTDQLEAGLTLWPATSATKRTPRPERFEFVLAQNRRGLLIECPEPIDWTRLMAGPLRQDSASTTCAELQCNERDTQILYNSDFTRALLILRSDSSITNISSSIAAFAPRATYLWTLTQYVKLPAHREWLGSVFEGREDEYTLTIEIPS